ncbi:MAG: hypothetical protein QM528_04620 [Phycisphaerales bacterium]|nr:hypothetical protein [Phycisphaerales bacterium]
MMNLFAIVSKSKSHIYCILLLIVAYIVGCNKTIEPPASRQLESDRFNKTGFSQQSFILTDLQIPHNVLVESPQNLFLFQIDAIQGYNNPGLILIADQRVIFKPAGTDHYIYYHAHDHIPLTVGKDSIYFDPTTDLGTSTTLNFTFLDTVNNNSIQKSCTVSIQHEFVINLFRNTLNTSSGNNFIISVNSALTSHLNTPLNFIYEVSLGDKVYDYTKGAFFEGGIFSKTKRDTLVTTRDMFNVSYPFLLVSQIPFINHLKVQVKAIDDPFEFVREDTLQF